MLQNNALALDGLVDLAQRSESPTVEFKKSSVKEKRARGPLKITEIIPQAGLEALRALSAMDVVTVTFGPPQRDGGVSGGVSAVPESLLHYIAAHRGQSAKTLAEVLGTPMRTIERWLTKLRVAGLIEFVGTPRTGGYHARSQSPNELE